MNGKNVHNIWIQNEEIYKKAYIELKKEIWVSQLFVFLTSKTMGFIIIVTRNQNETLKQLYS